MKQMKLLNKIVFQEPPIYRGLPNHGHLHSLLRYRHSFQQTRRSCMDLSTNDRIFHVSLSLRGLHPISTPSCRPGNPLAWSFGQRCSLPFLGTIEIGRMLVLYAGVTRPIGTLSSAQGRPLPPIPAITFLPATATNWGRWRRHRKPTERARYRWTSLY